MDPSPLPLAVEVLISAVARLLEAPNGVDERGFTPLHLESRCLGLLASVSYYHLKYFVYSSESQ